MSTSLPCYVCYRCPHTYVTYHYVCVTGVTTATSQGTTSVLGRPNSYIIRHYICDTGVPAVTSDVTASVIWVSAQLPQASLCL